MPHPEIESLRADLRVASYSPLAWSRFLAGSWSVARITARAHPRLYRSWRARALWRAATLPLLARLLGCAPGSAPLWATFAWQQADLYVHLGLNRAAESPEARDAFPLATEVTLVRAYAAAALLSGTTRPRLALVLGMASDLFDGYLARSRGDETALGALLDAEYDAYLWLAAAHAGVRRGALSPRVASVLYARFAVPLLAGIIAYAAAPSPVPVGSTRVGKVAGVIQSAAVYAALCGRTGWRGRASAVVLTCSAIVALAAQLGQYRKAMRCAEERHPLANLGVGADRRPVDNYP